LVAADLLADRYATDPPAVAALAEMVRHDRNPEVFLAAATALSRRPETIPRQSAGPVAEAGHGAVLRWRVEDDDPAIRRAALHVLGEFHGADPDVRDLVIDRVRHDGAIRVRRDALSILGERLPAGPAAHAVFVDCLDDPDWSIREAAVRVLARSYGTAAGTRDLLIRCAREHPDAGIRRLAGQALTWLPGADPEQLPAIAGPGPTGSRLVDPGRLPAVPG
jgi:HEAT repeat protein